MVLACRFRCTQGGRCQGVLLFALAQFWYLMIFARVTYCRHATARGFYTVAATCSGGVAVVCACLFVGWVRQANACRPSGAGTNVIMLGS